jgi:histone-binding protein RBBP4
MKCKLSQEDLIKEENNNWRKYSPILYELIISQALEWPSLTVEWHPISDRYLDYNKAKINPIV